MNQQVSKVTNFGSESVHLCAIGAYGTKYVRSDNSEVPTSIELVVGESQTISIENIYSFYTIGNKLAINMRQSAATTALDFVALNERSGATDVSIDSTG